MLGGECNCSGNKLHHSSILHKSHGELLRLCDEPTALFVSGETHLIAIPAPNSPHGFQNWIQSQLTLPSSSPINQLLPGRREDVLERAICDHPFSYQTTEIMNSKELGFLPRNSCWEKEKSETWSLLPRKSSPTFPTTFHTNLQQRLELTVKSQWWAEVLTRTAKLHTSLALHLNLNLI